MGLLEGRKAISYPAMEEELKGAQILRKPVVVDGHFVTSRGMGTAIDFALQMVAVLVGQEEAEQLAESIVYRA